MTAAFVTGGANVSYSNSNRTVSSTSGWSIVPLDSLVPNAGKFYAEFSPPSGNLMFGVARTSTVKTGEYPGQGPTAAVSLGDGARLFGSFTWVNSTDPGSLSAVIGVAVDNDNGKVRWYKNGALQVGEASFTPGAADIAIVVGVFTGRGSTTVRLPSEATIPPGYAYLGAPQVAVSGIVHDDLGNPAARTVRVYQRDTGALLASTTSNASTGAYSVVLYYTGEVQVICLDDSAGAMFNDLIARTTGV